MPFILVWVIVNGLLMQHYQHERQQVMEQTIERLQEGRG